MAFHKERGIIWFINFVFLIKLTVYLRKFKFKKINSNKKIFFISHGIYQKQIINQLPLNIS